VLGKALGGGILPIAAVIARPELDVGADYAFGHYTHEKNPVTARAALTTIQIIEEEGLVANAANLGVAALARLHDIMAKRAIVGDVRGVGLLFGIELVSDRAAKTPANAEAEKVMYLAMEKGLSFKTTFGNVLTLTPPLTVTQAQMDRALDIIDECLAAI
jgi:4-aminobutyrate aminotransferase